MKNVLQLSPRKPVRALFLLLWNTAALSAGFQQCFFDCTNYYFEIDLPCEDKQKGPSKENRHDPIIGQALLLDADLVPMAMQMYPGNESEKLYIRKII